MTDGQATSLFSSDRLIGLEEIESGFDVINMVSLAESESRFRIFDLSETGSNQFQVSVLGQQRMFNTPLNVQVTNINTRRVINCEDLSNDYKHFYSNYFRSTRSTSTWSAVIVGGSTSRHDTLRKIEEAINKQSKAVATSTSWWGLYSIQLGPPFFIQLDPMFNASMSAIINKQHVPRTESEQTLYNILLQTFGTHYVMHVVVGATAHMYTLINSAFTKSATFEETATEVSKMSNSFFLPKIVPKSMHSIKESLSESFRKNSRFFVEYQPPVALVPGKTEWQSWLDNAILTPVVVNRTLTPLSNIFNRYPLIRAHLRHTIDHYLRHGKYPKLAELNR
ncbi:unnamed protein product [Rotaria socialis]|uniref:MACPF domain-containing protein n=5 Tax=Rotaria socialis TaxID=392032 RepID=A0A820XE08_9BILA|nr:unnamed protein product [Rotaria socialis]CAF3175203.1 unnamed protein product [Rotaria socialis]CAF3311252.1 unnamed protein product [Rotaria socialis]CAF3318081.1 unnamed protein product [Rotaria socialis]CAF4530774.1 unnamed protein product [Rotaria socialis]